LNDIESLEWEGLIADFISKKYRKYNKKKERSKPLFF